LLLGVVLGVESADGVTEVPPTEMDSPTAETPAGAWTPTVVVGVVELTATGVAAGDAAAWADGDREVAGVVPVGATTSEMPVPFAVLAPTPAAVVAGAGE
jgi:hypothetical protein